MAQFYSIVSGPREKYRKERSAGSQWVPLSFNFQSNQRRHFSPLTPAMLTDLVTGSD